MAFSADVRTGNGPVDTKTGGSPQFRVNTFLHETNSTGAKIPGKDKGTSLREKIHQWREKDNKGEKKSEYFSFKEDTRAEMKTFLNNWAANIDDALRKPDGRDVLEAQRHSKEMAFVLGINPEEPMNTAELQKRIDQVLDTSEGWIAAKALLDQETAIMQYAAAIAFMGQRGTNPNYRRFQTYAHYLREYVDNGSKRQEGKIHKELRAGGRGAIKQWQTLSALSAAGIGAAMGGSVAGPIGAGIGAVSGAAVAGSVKLFRETFKRGQNTDAVACTEALQMIQNNEGLKKYVKLVSRMDADDFQIVDGEIQLAKPYADLGSRHTVEDFVLDVMRNTVTRRHYFRDIGVPPHVQDATPEQFILSNTGLFERTKERTHSDMVDIWQSLRKVAQDELRRRGPEKDPPPTDDEKRDALFTDASGRTDVLRGRYPEGVDIPPFNPDNVIPHFLDEWRQAEPDYVNDDPPFSETITPQDPQAEGWRFSDWAGKAPESEVSFLGAVRFPAGLRRIGMPDPGGSGKMIHMEDPTARDRGKMYLYEITIEPATRVTADRERRFSAENIQQNLVFITDTGERVRVEAPGTPPGSTDRRIRRVPGSAPLLGRERYEYFDPTLMGGTGAWRMLSIAELDNQVFYVPPPQARYGVAPDLPPGDGMPIPYRALDSRPASGTTPPDYEIRVGTYQTEIGENAFFRVEPATRTSWLPPRVTAGAETTMASSKTPGEDFYRDTQFFRPVGDPTSLLYGTGLTQRQLAARERMAQRIATDTLAPAQLQQYFNTVDAWIQTNGQPTNRAQRAALQQEIDKLKLSAAQLRSIRRAESEARRWARLESLEAGGPDWLWARRPDVFPIREIDPSRLLAEDMPDGARPAYKSNDIRFGIYDTAILTALDTLAANGPQAKFFDPATGKDVWGQDRSSPWFCIADRKNFVNPPVNPPPPPGTGPDLSKVVTSGPGFRLDRIARDQWGQEPTYPDGTQNKFFMVANEATFPRPEGRSDLELWLRARETVLANVTENLIRRLRLFPGRRISTIEAKIKSRESGGARITEMIDKANKEKPSVTEAQKIFAARVGDEGAITKFKKAEQALKDALDVTKGLPKFLTDHFGTTFSGKSPEDNARDAIAALEAALHTAGMDITIKGRTISSIADREQKLDEERTRAEQERDTRIPRPDDDAVDRVFESWEKRITEATQKIEERFAVYAKPIEADRKTIQDAITELQKYIKTIEENTQATTAPDGELYKAREKALRPQGTDTNKMSDLISGIAGTHWGTETVYQLLTRINAQHQKNPNYGWPADENDNEENLQILAYAMVQGRVTASGLTDTDDLREQILQQSLTQTTRRIAQIEKLATTALDDPELKAERGQLKVTRDAMKRQGAIFALTTQFMSERTDRLQIDTNGVPRTIKDLSDAELLAFGLTKDSSGNISLPTGLTDQMPAGLLKIYHDIFGWLGPEHEHDRKDFFNKMIAAYPPEALLRAMHSRAEETIPPITLPTGTLTAAQMVTFVRDLSDRTQELQISRRNLRRMLIGVLDDLENRALLLYDPEDISISSTPTKTNRETMGLAA